MTDTRTYRTEPEQPSAGAGRWGLYVDGHLLVRSGGPMNDVAARDWATSQLGERVSWLSEPHTTRTPSRGPGVREHPGTAQPHNHGKDRPR